MEAGNLASIDDIMTAMEQDLESQSQASRKGTLTALEQDTHVVKVVRIPPHYQRQPRTGHCTIYEISAGPVPDLDGADVVKTRVMGDLVQLDPLNDLNAYQPSNQILIYGHAKPEINGFYALWLTEDPVRRGASIYSPASAAAYVLKANDVLDPDEPQSTFVDIPDGFMELGVVTVIMQAWEYLWHTKVSDGSFLDMPEENRRLYLEDSMLNLHFNMKFCTEGFVEILVDRELKHRVYLDA